MEPKELNPFIRYCETVQKPTSFGEPIRAYDCRVFFALSGEGRVRCGDREYLLLQDSFIYIPAGVPYCLGYAQTPVFSAIVLNFDLTGEHSDMPKAMCPDICPRFREDHLIKCPQDGLFSEIVYIRCAPMLKEQLAAMTREFALKRPYFAEYASAQLSQVLIGALRFTEDSVKNDGRLAVRLREYITEHYSEDIGSQSLRRDFSYHPYYLNRVFRTSFGVSLHRYLICYRLDTAKQMLLTTEMSVTEISKSVGFTSQTHFSSAFREYTGLSPSDYRTSNARRNA